jgi:hypothetical protein
MNRWFCAALSILIGSLASCAGVESPLDGDVIPQTADCARWLAKIDQAVERAGVRDAGAYRIPGFPYLRIDRFSASLRNEVKDDPRGICHLAGSPENARPDGTRL